MLRVILADDEERILKLIRILADWDMLSMQVVGTADNGLDALALVERLRPDIMITDIRMPGLDGLEMIGRAKRVAPELEVIIISGYAQFDYAQTAIQYGVGDYLLKPINKDALNNTLDKMGERCRARRRSAEDIERLRHVSRDGRERLRDNLIGDLCAGRFAAMDAAQVEEKYRFEATADTSQVFMLKMDCDAKHLGDQSMDIVSAKAADVFTPVLSEYCGDFVIGFRNGMMVGVMNYRSDVRSAIRGRLRACLNQLVALKSLFGSMAFSLALGQAVSSPAALAQSYDKARVIIAERLTEGTGRLLEGEVAASGVLEGNLLARYVQAVANAIDVLSVDEAAQAADALELAAVQAPGIRGFELLEIARGAGMVFATRVGLENREQVIEQFNDELEHCCYTHDLFACLKALQRESLEKAALRRSGQEGQPIRMAKQYIHKHFSGPLTLEEVSAACGFSVNYFSTLFKKETGEGFLKYLARIRVEEAKSLLRETRLPVLEICKRVGYGDIKHFTRTFRQEAGVTPGEFRKLYG